MSFQLRRGGVIGGAAVGALALVTVGAGLASAQVGSPISVSPGSGEPGTTITVSGSGCDGDAVSLLLSGNNGTVDVDTASVDASQSWTGQLVADDSLVDLGETLTITADCLGGTIEYDTGVFEVIGVPPTTDTTAPPVTDPPTTEPPVTEPPVTEPPVTAPPSDDPGPDPTAPDPTAPAGPDAPAPTPAPEPAAPVTDTPDYAG
ncbi:MAG TPA: hypothetical protein VIL36_21365 [Acidimicrobiales bacterium]